MKWKKLTSVLVNNVIPGTIIMLILGGAWYFVIQFWVSLRSKKMMIKSKPTNNIKKMKRKFACAGVITALLLMVPLVSSAYDITSLPEPNPGHHSIPWGDNISSSVYNTYGNNTTRNVWSVSVDWNFSNNCYDECSSPYEDGARSIRDYINNREMSAYGSLPYQQPVPEGINAFRSPILRFQYSLVSGDPNFENTLRKAMNVYPISGAIDAFKKLALDSDFSSVDIYQAGDYTLYKYDITVTLQWEVDENSYEVGVECPERLLMIAPTFHITSGTSFIVKVEDRNDKSSQNEGKVDIALKQRKGEMAYCRSASTQEVVGYSADLSKLEALYPDLDLGRAQMIWGVNTDNSGGIQGTAPEISKADTTHTYSLNLDAPQQIETRVAFDLKDRDQKDDKCLIIPSKDSNKSPFYIYKKYEKTTQSKVLDTPERPAPAKVLRGFVNSPEIEEAPSPLTRSRSALRDIDQEPETPGDIKYPTKLTIPLPSSEYTYKWFGSKADGSFDADKLLGEGISIEVYPTGDEKFYYVACNELGCTGPTEASLIIPIELPLAQPVEYKEKVTDNGTTADILVTKTESNGATYVLSKRVGGQWKEQQTESGMGGAISFGEQPEGAYRVEVRKSDELGNVANVLCQDFVIGNNNVRSSVAVIKTNNPVRFTPADHQPTNYNYEYEIDGKKYLDEDGKGRTYVFHRVGAYPVSVTPILKNGNIREPELMKIFNVENSNLSTGKPEVVISPVFSSDLKVVVKSMTDEKVSVFVIDAEGKKGFRTLIDANQGDNEVLIPVSSLPDGRFIVYAYWQTSGARTNSTFKIRNN